MGLKHNDYYNFNIIFLFFWAYLRKYFNMFPENISARGATQFLT